MSETQNKSSSDPNVMRGMEHVRGKLGKYLRGVGHSDALESIMEVIDQRYAGKIGVMPVNGLLSASKFADALVSSLSAPSEKELPGLEQALTAAEEACKVVPIERAVTNKQGAFGTEGRMVEIELSDADQLILDELNENVSESDIETIDMVKYMPKELLTAEGKRAAGFLPADFDATMEDGDELESGDDGFELATVSFSDNGDCTVQCPYSGSAVIYQETGDIYKCLECDDCKGFRIHGVSMSDFMD